MLAVILAAGYGTRMGDLTKDAPKPMLLVCGTNLIEHKIRALPARVTDVVIVVGYKGEVIKNFFGKEFLQKRIHYAEDVSRTGTAHALFAAHSLIESLTKESFLVLMGDDIYDAPSLREAASYPCALICKRAHEGEDGGRIVLNQEGVVESFVTPRTYAQTRTDPGLIFTGGYVLPCAIFTYDPVKLQTRDEWGLPQTVASAASVLRPTIVETSSWISISTPEDLADAEAHLCGSANVSPAK